MSLVVGPWFWRLLSLRGMSIFGLGRLVLGCSRRTRLSKIPPVIVRRASECDSGPISLGPVPYIFAPFV